VCASVSSGGRMTLSRQIVKSARALTFERLPGEVIDKVKTGLLDVLSCAFEARTLPWSEQAIRIVSDSAGPATVIATPHRVPPADAAFANAILGHGLVREDMHTGSVSHLGVVIYPTLLALSQTHRVTGRDFVLAAVCGYEVGGSIGRALMDREMVRRVRPTGITGPLAGAAAGSRLLGLDEDAAVSALGLAANTVGGWNEWPYSGGDEMFFQAGFAARSAVTAVQLAALGARASQTALDGPSGLFAGLGKAERIGAVATFSGGPLEILSVYYKPAPACNYAQTACQGALALARELPGGRTAEIQSILVKVPAAAVEYPGCNYAGPFERILQAKMSIQYCVAATLVSGAIEEANYHRLSDPEILRLAGITTLEADPGLTAAYPAMQGAEVIVMLRNGHALRHRLDGLTPATPAGVRARFRAALGAAAAAIEARVDALEQQQDVGELCAALSSAMPGGGIAAPPHNRAAEAR
jgi:2-methylcitrate dehydratase PrpD